MTRRVVAIALLLMTHSAFGAENARILVPVFLLRYPGPSIWDTAVVVNNFSDRLISTPGLTFISICFIPEGCRSQQIPPRSFAALVDPISSSGVVLEVPAEIADQVVFSGRIAAAPRYVGAGGTELPIVRERDFRQDFVHLPYVALRAPTPQDIRTHIRIYSMDEGPVTVRLELRSWYAVAGNAEFARDYVLLHGAAPGPAAFRLVDLQNEFDPYAASATVNVDIVPLPRSNGTVPRVWAFASITDNRTNEVTLVTPR